LCTCVQFLIVNYNCGLNLIIHNAYGWFVDEI
jgi:hypothetical protein